MLFTLLLACVLDQRLKEVQAGLIVAQGLFRRLAIEHELAVVLGVELNAEAEGLILTLDRFNDLHAVIRCGADNGEIRPLNAADGLMMPGGNILQLRGADNLIEPLGSILIDGHIVAGISTIRCVSRHSVRIVVGLSLFLIIVGDILNERAAGNNGHHLLAAAALHLAFAQPMVWQILQIFGIRNLTLFLGVTGAALLVFALLYCAMYRLTSNAYYRIVSTQNV